MGKSPIMFLIFTVCSLAPPPWDVDCKNRIHTIKNPNELIFQLHGADRRGRVLHRAKVSRGSLFESVRMLKPRLVVMEACSSAQH